MRYLRVFLIILLGVFLFSVGFRFFRKGGQKGMSKKNFCRVGIIDCSGDRQALAQMKNYLEDKFFQVEHTMVGLDTFSKTMIVEHRSPSLENGKFLGEYLSYKKNRLFLFRRRYQPAIFTFYDSTLYLEATVIIGKDYKQILNVLKDVQDRRTD